MREIAKLELKNYYYYKENFQLQQRTPMRELQNSIPENIFLLLQYWLATWWNSQEIFHWFSWLMEVNWNKQVESGCRLLEEGFTNKLESQSVDISPAHNSAPLTVQLCVLPPGHTHYALVNTGPKVLLFKVFKRKMKKKKQEKKREVDVLVPDFEFVRKCTFMFGDSKNLLGKELK